jgi:acyl transferase domain-containing protein/NAD(P)-dependent dehydrogenase (short-subunit alcohol dehydrogenase family)/acyl carrier protein
MACRFPGGAVSPDQYWEILRRAEDATAEVPADRWSLNRFFSARPELPGKAYVRRGGFLRQSIDEFDAAFFGISPREATLLDPQQRLLLEIVWEGLEDAGILPREIRASNTGVYIGGFTMDNLVHLLNVLNRESITTHTATGSTLGMLSNRLSYTLDLRGPSLSVDTACSSSLVAVHLACQALIGGECEMAIAGGVNVMLRPEYTIAMCKGGFLSPDGRSKAFDASGDGYGRGEGAGVIILKLMTAALHDGDPIRAVIAGTGVNQDGRTDGIASPSSAAQTALIRKVHSRAGIGPDEIQYVEAHGTGTRAGDSAEAAALGEVLATRRSGGEALWLGSVKTNIGHLEAAAGIAAIIKTTLALERRTIPPSLHFRNPHPEIDFAKLRLRVPVCPEPWPKGTVRAGAAVNSFGFGGTNAHAILLEAPPQDTTPNAAAPRPAVFPLSAASEVALGAQARQIADCLEARPDINLVDLGYTLARRRTHHKYRVGVVAATRAALEAGLRSVAGAKAARSDARLAFIYTGMGTQFYGMGTVLLEREESARQVLEMCDQVWEPLAGWPLKTLFARSTGEPMTAPEHAQPANLVLQLMLTEVARSYGLSPDGVVGHSVGEIAAACVAGLLSIRDAIWLVYHRSRLQQRLAGWGKMLAVGLSVEEMQPYLKSVDGRLAIAAVNSPTSVTVAGDSDAIVFLNEILTVERIFSRVLQVAVAYHSHHLDRLADEFGSSLGNIGTKAPDVPMFSSVTGAALYGQKLDAAYWWRNARQPVLFADAAAAMIGDGFNTFVEIGPHPALSVAIGSCLRRAGVEGESFALQQRGQNEIDALLATIAQVHGSGVLIDWSSQYPSGKLVSLPPYPWDRRKLWSETEASRADRLGMRQHPLLAPRLNEPQAAWEGELTLELHSYLPDHQIQGETILPIAAFVEMALVAKQTKGEPIAVEMLTIHRSLAVEQTPLVRLYIDSDGASFSIFSHIRDSSSKWALNASGRLVAAPAPARAQRLDRPAILSRCPAPVDIERLYRTFAGLGLQYGVAFQCLREAWRSGNEILGRIEASPSHIGGGDDYYLHPTVLDAALQAMLALRVEEGTARQTMFLPVEIGQIRFQHKPGCIAWCHGLLTREDENALEGDLVLYDERGEVATELFGVRVRSVPVPPTANSWKDDILYRLDWRIQTARPASEFLTRNWLVFCDSGEVGKQIAKDARARRISCTLVLPGNKFEQRGETVFTVARESSNDIARLLTAIGADRLDAIVYLWGLDIADSDEDREALSVTGTASVVDLVNIVRESESKRSKRGLEGLTLCIATVRAQDVTEIAVAAERRQPGQNALIGAGRVLAIEKPQLSVKMVDLNSSQQLMASASLIGELLSASNEGEVAFRNGARYVPRVVRWTGPRHRTALSGPETRYILKSATPGRGGRLEFHEAGRIAPGPGEVEIAVQFSAIGSAGSSLQVQSAGIVKAVGAGVRAFGVNDEVVVLTSGTALTSHLTLPADSLIHRPKEVSWDQAIALLDWAAAYYSLFVAGRLSRGETILIHHAETGIGQAAIHLAKWKGAQVLATADTTGKQDFLRSLGLTHVSDAHTLRFADDIASWTGGRGVDVVLSSVSGDLREKSLAVVAAGGRFIDVSAKSKGLKETLPIMAFQRGLEYFCVNPTTLGRQQLTGCIGSEFGAIRTTTFHVTQVEEALRLLIRDEHTGKVIIDLQSQRVPIARWLPARVIDPDAGYLITGGFSGLGLATLRWLASKGARFIAVFSRSGPVSEEAMATVARLRALGVRIIAEKVDIAEAVGLRGAVGAIARGLPPLRGVIHSAAVIEDAPIGAIDPLRAHRVMNPKALGGWNLHRALLDCDLDFFVCYSSVTSLLGNAGQITYAAANAFLDGLMAYRRSLGLPGLSVNWGVIADVGTVARDERIANYLRQLGLRPLTSDRALELIEEAISEKWGNFGAFDIDWQRWRTQVSSASERLLEEVLSPAHGNDHPAVEFRGRVIEAASPERFDLVYTEIAKHVCRALGIPDSQVDATTSLGELGIDSLMAVEVAVGIEQRTGFRFRALSIARGPTIAQLSKEVLDYVLSTA